MNPKVVANNDQPIKNIEKSSSPSIINFETLIARILKYWYVLVLSVIIGYFIGTALNRWYFSKIYSNYLTMNISANSSAQTNSASQSVNFFWGNTSENEVMLAKKELFSRTHNEKLVHEFNLFVKYKVQGRITSTNIDQEDSPYLVEIDKNHPQALYQEFTIEKISDTHFKVTFLKEKNNLTYNYSQEKYFHNIKDELPQEKILKQNEWFISKSYKFKIKLNPQSSIIDDGNKIVVKLITINDAVSEILSSLVFEQDKELKTVVNLSKTGYSLVGITNFLNKSVDMLSNKIKVDKSLGSKNTLEYINKNLKYVKSKLDSVTLNFEKTKSEGGIIDIKTEISGILSQLKEIEAKKAELSIKLNAINDLIRSYNSNLNESLNPSMVGIDDPEINQNIIKIREIENIKIEKERFYLPNSEPMKEFNRQIQNLKKEGLNRLKYYYKVFNEEQTKLESELFEINNKISNLPEREKKYLEAERAFTSASKIYEGLYNRRVEAELLLSNTDSGIRVLDQAKLLNQSPISPNFQQNLLIGMVIGLLLPLLYLFAIEIIDNRIKVISDLKRSTQIPLIGVVGPKPTENNLTVLDRPKSSVSEAFRAIRSNLKYLYKEKEILGGKVVLCSSSIGGEGKTFVSINIASVLALSNAKTVLLGMDLRKPKIFDDFNISNKIGVSNYLSFDADVNDIIQKTKLSSLDIIPAGPIPPNPSELLMSQKCDELISELRKIYDFVVIDSPPVGLVADGFDLMRLSDVNLYVVRCNYTVSNLLSSVNEKYNNKEVEHIGIIFNDFEANTGTDMDTDMDMDMDMDTDTDTLKRIKILIYLSWGK